MAQWLLSRRGPERPFSRGLVQEPDIELGIVGDDVLTLEDGSHLLVHLGPLRAALEYLTRDAVHIGCFRRTGASAVGVVSDASADDSCISGTFATAGWRDARGR
jgi:hypothetical protein